MFMALRFFLLFFICISSFFSFSISGQDNVSIREYSKEFITYPYSDANPIPSFGKTYPYYRYDGFTSSSEKRLWKIVEIENEWLRIQVFPEIGGKIWSVVDKLSDKEMFYGNNVVKFRDISLRGPWTSGGIEFNYGVVGHSPSCSFPVDYLLEKKSDGSVSCYINTLDLLTRTYWTVEINLPADKGWFTTRSFWHNKTGLFQPYYNWVNTGVKAKNDLRFIYPGTDVIQHNGESFPWPMETVNTKNLSQWRDLNFGSSKSFHITGQHAPYFGAYWEDEKWGIMQYAERDNKLGRKIFSWALSDQGKIWEELLTDNDGQYVELQSGRLFNQNMATSSLTPFKQTGFAPYVTDIWTEYWFPYRDTNGVSNVTLKGVVNVTEQHQGTSIQFSPLQNVHESLSVFNSNEDLLYNEKRNFRVGETVSLLLPADTEENKASKIMLDDIELWSNRDRTLSRPASTVEDFNWNSVYGNYLRGRDLYGLRQNVMAEQFIRKSLELDENYLPSLVEMSKLHYYRMEYDSAFATAKKALSIDTYDGAANYMYAISAVMLDRIYDAFDGFEVATLTNDYRSAAFTELSKLYFKQEDFASALSYAKKSLINNQFNIDGLQLLYLSSKHLQDEKKAAKTLNNIREIDPLNHFVRFEKYFEEPDTIQLTHFTDYIRGEMPEQVYLELALWYYQLNLTDRAIQVLNLSPINPEVAYWIAFLQYQAGNGTEKSYVESLQRAYSLNPTLVFPFREESKIMFEWAVDKDPTWKTKYFLALLHSSRNNSEKAYELLNSVNEDVPFAPFYVFLSQLSKDSEDKEKALLSSVSQAPGQWRYLHELTRYYLIRKEYDKALDVIAPFYKKESTHFPTGLLYVRTLLGNNDYRTAEKVLDKINILPFEGAKDGQLLYRQTKLRLAADAISSKKFRTAKRKISEARLWPRNLGVGKPFEENIDYRIEHLLEAVIAHLENDGESRRKHLQKTIDNNREKTSINALLGILALYQIGETNNADLQFEEWLSNQKTENIKNWGISFYNTNKLNDNLFDYENMKRIIGLIAGVEDARLF
ncbi:DUF5107 domain-containing protein [Petrimonas sulfuriphila]|uniref:DUF5107 domain-containing protein n=1 Tax=Petrimonas sulfuriphila TaxID=285070 RepID=UPI003EB80177